MNLVIFTHPSYLHSQSMPKFSAMIVDGMLKKGHKVKILTASPFFYKLPFPEHLKKWLGYFDSYILFPIYFRFILYRIPLNTLFIFSDQALGLWVRLVVDRPNLIHVHDFMALRSALGDFQMNHTSWTGKIYQNIIRNGFNLSKNFISVSKITKQHLHEFLYNEPEISEVVYNGLNYSFAPLNTTECIDLFISHGLNVPYYGYLMHIGGNQWYKNREGVLKIYMAYVKLSQNPLPLLMIGQAPTLKMEVISDEIKQAGGSVQYVLSPTDREVCAIYSMASILIFPSIAEGFGWPIIEAMSCGCSVITTNDAPMTEVGGDAAYYIDRMPLGNTDEWAINAAEYIIEILNKSESDIFISKKRNLNRASFFKSSIAIDQYEKIYQRVIASS